MFLEKNEEKKKELQEEYKTFMPDLAKKLEALLVKNGGKFFVGDSVRKYSIFLNLCCNKKLSVVESGRLGRV